ncbi:MAG: PTS sugar transporter subunit IIA [Candidatus Protistobacter heckmanni]|nr:PTS sugar transporter subunit IIA [Candidatus Protistobacter heckmanni]
MNRLAELLPTDHILLDIAAEGKQALFERIGALFERLHGVNGAMVTENLFARETLGSTGLGAGVGIPHGRIKGLKQQLAAFVRLAEPIEFGSPDKKPVNLLFFLLVPEQATQQHLETLSSIAQLLSDKVMRQALAEEPAAQSVRNLLRDWKA